jgi:hypothetical protein
MSLRSPTQDDNRPHPRLLPEVEGIREGTRVTCRPNLVPSPSMGEGMGEGAKFSKEDTKNLARQSRNQNDRLG